MSDIIKEKTAKRLSHLDILRILAIYFVAFNHSGEKGYMLFANETGSVFYIPYMIFSVLCKIAVPIFFMISGALLLPKQESLKQLFQKRVLRMVAVLILVSIPYYYLFVNSQRISISSFLTYIYSDNATTALWYLYSYIGLLLLLPFLRSMVKNMTHKMFVYLFIGHIILVGVLPCLEYCLWGGSVALNESFSSVLFVTQNVFYALMGYYLEHILDKDNYSKKTVLVSVILSILAVALTCLVTHYQIIRESICSNQQLESFFNCFICIPAMTVYFLIKFACLKLNSQKIQKVLATLGSAVFGVYLIEKLCRVLTASVHTLLSPIVGSFVASLVWCFVTCVLAFFIIIILKNIPFVKKIVNKFI